MAGDIASRDENDVPSLLGASNADGKTPVKIYADPSTHRLLVNGVGITGPTGPQGATGSISGPTGSVDNAVVLFSGTGGTVVKAALATIGATGLFTSYGGTAVSGFGVPAILGYGRSTAQTAAVASVATYTPANDGSFMVGGNVNVTAYTSGTFTFQVNYFDETNTSVTFNMQGHFTSGYGTSINGVGAFEVQPVCIRVKSGTAITLKTAGTFTNLTYNVEGTIMQIA